MQMLVTYMSCPNYLKLGTTGANRAFRIMNLFGYKLVYKEANDVNMLMICFSEYSL